MELHEVTDIMKEKYRDEGKAPPDNEILDEVAQEFLNGVEKLDIAMGATLESVHPTPGVALRVLGSFLLDAVHALREDTEKLQAANPEFHSGFTVEEAVQGLMDTVLEEARGECPHK